MTNPIDMDPDKTGEFCVEVYPNPTSNYLTIEVSDVPAGDILCSLFNGYGHLVARQSISSGTIQLNVSGFPKGFYTVVITADGVKTVEKLMIDSTGFILKNNTDSGDDCIAHSRFCWDTFILWGLKKA